MLLSLLDGLCLAGQKLLERRKRGYTAECFGALEFLEHHNSNEVDFCRLVWLAGRGYDTF
jgi:hypothetical protein